MVNWGRTYRQWKRAAEDAVALHRFSAERDRLAAAVAKRIWVANGGRSWAEANNEGALLLLEALAARRLHDGVIRRSLALQHLDVLRESRQVADYEDAASLRAEERWVTEFFEVGDSQAGSGGNGLSTASQAEALYRELMVVVLADLRVAGVAA